MLPNKIFISIIIPTYKRQKLLLKILERFKKNFLNFKNFEVIICDSSNSNDTKMKIEVFKTYNNLFKITYLNINKNLHTLKRNLGIKSASGNYVILLDDDCLPDYNFVKDYYLILKNNYIFKSVFCGSVTYPKILLKNNFIKYRNSRHFVVDNYNVLEKSLGPEHIVTMNMGFKKNSYFLRTCLFNEEFNNYGFEDFEFGFRLKKNNYRICKSKPLVVHNDFRDFSIYLKKIYYLGFHSMKYLIKLNPIAAKYNNFYKLEYNFFTQIFLNFNTFKHFLIIIKQISIFLEKHIFYFPIIYKAAIAASYLEGCFDKKHGLYKENKNEWYK